MSHLRPAHETKHLSSLDISFANSRFIIEQTDNGISNGSALWLSGQVMACYLTQHLLAVASLGYKVLATDLPLIANTLLVSNTARNYLSGSIRVVPVDWTEPFPWHDQRVEPPFSLIVTTDTVYSPSLVTPLLQTLHNICTVSASAKPIVLLGLERRDPQLVDQFFSQAVDVWSFKCDRIRHKHVVQAMERVLGKVHMWKNEDYESVELWKLKLSLPKAQRS
ncbi:hypothetical protein DL96DRAFT_1666836 [Flagelloscypha sp. PMI_526]|nr:hypothetical protein DL96DRAFT_1666836 [Flagelloscypha sp. PMI_526]